MNKKEILSTVCRELHCSPGELIGPCQEKEIVFPRHLAMYAMRKLTKNSLRSIAMMFQRDKNAVFYAERRIQKDITEGRQSETISRVIQILSI